MAHARPFVIAALALTALSSSGCEKKITAVCEEKCGGAAAACIDASEAAEATPEERGCEGEFEAYASCADAKATCEGGVLDAKAACAAEIDALDACLE
jgi:hypothetical protein